MELKHLSPYFKSNKDFKLSYKMIEEKYSLKIPVH